KLMFATLSRFRRQIAVLTALAMVASVLVAVPVAADEHPEQDYTATFDACMGVPASDFEDVPAKHPNAGDIDCIAYYNITHGTSMTTYSPLMSVNREQMALFLTRLAGLVSIELASDPDDAGFTDIGELSAESQTAINQLADLGVTQGTSTTTYSPGDSVKRGQMALFLARLMDKMDPMAEDSETVFGYTPEDVVDVVDDEDTTDKDETKKVKSPFTDLQSSTKEAYDAITALWELGVASGINATSYAPGANITRAAMAEFIAGVLDHSNARPAGVTIQASKTSDFGGYSDSRVAVSYRDDMFAPMVDVSIKTFDSDTVGAFDEDGGCETPADCAWTDAESLTDASGNIYVEGTVDNGKMNTYYAWMGDADADENDFDVDTSTHASVTLSSTTDAVHLKVTTDINENSTTKNTVDIDATSSVTLTAQLVDSDGDPVAKSGVEVKVSVIQGEATVYPPPAARKTDDDGQVTYTASGPKSTKGNTDPDRLDVIRFMSDVDESGGDPADSTADTVDGTVAVGGNDENVAATIIWTDSNPTLVTIDEVAEQTRAAQGSGKGSTDAYAFLSGQGKVTVRATVSFYDQYGNPAGKGNKVSITIGEATAGLTTPDNLSTRTVSSRGMASWRRTLDTTLGADVTVAYALRNAADEAALDGGPEVANTTVVAVRHADDDSTAAATPITAVYDKEDRFRITGALYSYDDGDTFINGIPDHADTGDRITLDTFEGLIKPGTGGTAGTVEVVFYDDDGVSIFRVTLAGS
ncbi:MAG: S-layer homology domain-containing protein, partial [Acidimicrobiia bacterium]|nr:S-layer homology domain-containing protein [Acidimicrobiia bacterium]